MANAQSNQNPNQALWEKGDFTRIAQSMRESGAQLVETLDITPGLDVLDLGCGDGTTALPAAEPRIEFNLLSDERDLVRLGSGFLFACEIYDDPAVRAVVNDVFPSSYTERIRKLNRYSAFNWTRSAAAFARSMRRVHQAPRNAPIRAETRPMRALIAISISPLPCVYSGLPSAPYRRAPLLRILCGHTACDGSDPRWASSGDCSAQVDERRHGPRRLDETEAALVGEAPRTPQAIALEPLSINLRTIDRRGRPWTTDLPT